MCVVAGGFGTVIDGLRVVGVEVLTSTSIAGSVQEMEVWIPEMEATNNLEVLGTRTVEEELAGQGKDQLAYVVAGEVTACMDFAALELE